MSICSLTFGFSVNFWVAVGCRCLMGLCNGKSLQQTQTHLCFLQSTLVSIRESNSVYIKDSVMLNPIPPEKARPLLQFQTSQIQAKAFLEHLLCTQVRVYIQYILSTCRFDHSLQGCDIRGLRRHKPGTGHDHSGSSMGDRLYSGTSHVWCTSRPHRPV